LFSSKEAAGLSEFPRVATPGRAESFPGYLVSLIRRQIHYSPAAPINLKKKLSALLSRRHGSNRDWPEINDQQAAQLVAELKHLPFGTLTGLIDAKSHWTAGHSTRATHWAVKIARAMGVSERELEIIYRGGLAHDIGKIAVPAAIIDKPGKLTLRERQQMREHVRIGARIMEPIPGYSECMSIILQHHEWVDGSGYPEGLAGDEISLHARILAVADCYDAMISDRPYRPGMPPERVEEMLAEGIGKQFDAQAVETFLNLFEPVSGKEAVEDVSVSLVMA
jgi:putative nucleotidyltransferase with HDIG domain